MPSKSRKTPDRPVLQWAAALLGGVVALGAAGIIGAEALQPAAPADLVARVVSTRPASQGHVAEVEVHNDGAAAAAAVEIEGLLGEQTARAVLDYVPGRGRATAYLAFDADPGAAQVSVRGWSEP